MTMDNWVKKFIGKGLDYDNAYGIQCVDLVKHFVANVLGVTPQSIGNAIEYYNKRHTSDYLTHNFKWIGNTAEFVPQKGDVCVFTSKSGLGHVSIASGEGNEKYFYSYDQNYPSSKHEPMTKIKHGYSSFLGVLRPLEQGNIVNAPKIEDGKYTLTEKRYVYNGYGTATKRKKVSQLTADGKKHATSTKATAEACLKKGTVVSISKVKKISTGNVWAKIPSGYILVWYHNDNNLCIK